ncbi:MAG: phosphomannomutase/phosphoglucomutase [Eubacteriales bacterium]|nr:phosphomannomutase/phosphoglucomutase [Eubacteriales bacterium]
MNDLKKLQNGSDIRGVAMEGVAGEEVNLTSEAAKAIGSAFALWLSKKSGVKTLRISIGRDSRLSGEMLKDSLCEGIVELGHDVSDFGMASTPAMFMSTVLDGYKYDGAIMVTASHLPFNRNGFKFFTPSGGLEKQDIAEILSIAQENQFAPAEKKGKKDRREFMTAYSKYLADKIRQGINDKENYEKPLSGFKIVVDAGNGAGGFFVDKVLQPLGADTTGSQFLDPDGNFPNHIPNPEDKDAMASIIRATVENGADLGIIFDTDVDRSGAVDKNGKEINRNRIIALMSAIVLEEHPGSYIVTDSITSDQLKVFIEDKLGGVHHRFKRGYRNVINEAIRLGNEGKECHLAIETSGHGALKENYFLDDGAYMMVKILIKMALLRKEGKTIDSLLSQLEEPAEAIEFRLKLNTSDFSAYGNNVIAELTEKVGQNPIFKPAANNYEGIRVSLGENDGDGWFLLRMSLHDPLMPLNIESQKVGGAKQIAKIVHDLLKDYTALDLSTIENYIK